MSKELENAFNQEFSKLTKGKIDKNKPSNYEFVISSATKSVDKVLSKIFSDTKFTDKFNKAQLKKLFTLMKGTLDSFSESVIIVEKKKRLEIAFHTTLERKDSKEVKKVCIQYEHEKDSIYWHPYTTKVVGVSFDNENGINRQKILTQLSSGAILKLINDRNNPYDKNAIKVVSEHGCIGFLSRDEAFRFSMKHISLGECFITSLKRVSNGYLGCLINFKYHDSAINV